MAAFLTGPPQHCYYGIHWFKTPSDMQVLEEWSTAIASRVVHAVLILGTKGVISSSPGLRTKQISQ